MQRIITISENTPVNIVNQFPNGFQTELISERSYSLKREGISSDIHEVIFNGIHLEYFDSKVEKEFKLDVDYGFPLLKMQFELEGHSSFKSKDKEDLDILIPGGQHQLFYHPKVDGTLTYHKNRKVFEVMFSSDFIYKVFGNSLEALGLFGEAIKQNKPALLGANSLPILAEMKHIIQNIIFCKLTGKLKETYIEIKIIELLITQIQQFKNQQKYTSQTTIKSNDIEKLYLAKKLIEEHIQESISIDQLSKLVGLNTFKLKTGFKTLFNNTIFNYLTQTRMNYAKKIIATGEKNISETALLVGYKNPQHFTTAFKKTFGYLPSELYKRN